MELVHTLLFLLREDRLQEDMVMIKRCLKSLEKSTYKTVVVYNQGFWDNEQLRAFLKGFELDCIVIGEGMNHGIVVGRQRCFQYIWENHPEVLFISELHLDMMFTHRWEDALVAYLKVNDEPMICAGIVSKNGTLVLLNETASVLPEDAVEDMDAYLMGLRRDVVVYGLTHPCIHKSEVLRAVGGYDTHFLVGRQAYEDDSLLLGYHYYYGTRKKWRPKVNYQSVVYHEIAGQRLALGDNEMINFAGLLKQYGAMGMKHLSMVHQDIGHIVYFAKQFYRMRDGKKL